jgi:hypothetical protein
MNNYKDELTCR